MPQYYLAHPLSLLILAVDLPCSKHHQNHEVLSAEVLSADLEIVVLKGMYSNFHWLTERLFYGVLLYFIY